MRRLLLLILIIFLMSGTVYATEFTAPSVPEAAEKYMPRESKSFGSDLLYIFKTAIGKIRPDIADASECCLSLIVIMILVSILKNFSGAPKHVIDLTGTIFTGILLLKPSNALIKLGINTITELSEYGKLLMPVLTGALAAQGGATGATALYTGTIVFNTVLMTAITKLIIPMIYMYIALSVSCSAVGEQTLNSLRSFSKWLMTWTLKIILYVFTGYMSVTKVVSGTTDAAAMKATKLAINGMVPVVGNIVSDASEAILVSAGLMKNAVGTYGLLALIAVWIGPFLQIGLQYILLKITASVCAVFGSGGSIDLIKSFVSVMGFLLAMTGAVCMMLLISIVCFMKGAG